MNANRWMLFVCLGGAFASAIAEHAAPNGFAFSLRGASSHEVLEIASVALAPMRFDLAERTLSSSDASLQATFRSGAANQIVLAGTPDCIVAIVTVVAASSAANAEQIRRTIAQHFATNMREAAGTRVIFHGITAERRACLIGSAPAAQGQRVAPLRFKPNRRRGHPS